MVEDGSKRGAMLIAKVLCREAYDGIQGTSLWSRSNLPARAAEGMMSEGVEKGSISEGGGVPALFGDGRACWSVVL